MSKKKKWATRESSEKEIKGRRNKFLSFAHWVIDVIRRNMEWNVYIEKCIWLCRFLKQFHLHFSLFCFWWRCGKNGSSSSYSFSTHLSRIRRVMETTLNVVVVDNKFLDKRGRKRDVYLFFSLLFFLSVIIGKVSNDFFNAIYVNFNKWNITMDIEWKRDINQREKKRLLLPPVLYCAVMESKKLKANCKEERTFLSN